MPSSFKTRWTICAVASLAAQPRFDDRAPARRLEIIQIGEDRIIHRQGNVVVDVADFAFSAAAQIGIEFLRLRDRLLGDFIDGRGGGFLLAEPVPGAEGFELIEAHRVDNVVVQAAQGRVGIEVISAGKQLVERLVELLPGLAEMPGLEILLARVEGGLAVRRKPLGSVWPLDGKRRQNFALRIERQRGKGLVLGRQGNLGGPDLYGASWPNLHSQPGQRERRRQ